MCSHLCHILGHHYFKNKVNFKCWFTVNSKLFNVFVVPNEQNIDVITGPLQMIALIYIHLRLTVFISS